MSTFIPFGNTSQMTFSSVNTNELIYANQGLYGIKIPDNVLQVLHGSTPGVYSWSYITPLSMGLTSNVNQMFYTTSDTASIKSVQLPVDTTTGYMLTYNESNNVYEFKSIAGSYVPSNYFYKGFTKNKTSLIGINNVDLSTLYLEDRTTNLTFDKLIPTHSYQCTFTLRFWLNDYTSINPPDNCSIEDYKTNIASRITIECTLRNKVSIVFDTLIGNVAMQEYQITQTSLLPCDNYGQNISVSPVFKLNATNGGSTGIILEPYIACLEASIIEVPNTVYIGIQPILECYQLTCTTVSVDSPYWITASPDTGFRASPKLAWTLVSNLQGAVNKVNLIKDHYYWVQTTLKLFFKNPNQMSPATGATVLEWKQTLPVISLFWSDAPSSKLELVTGMFANIATMCYEITGTAISSKVFNTVENDVNLSLEYTNSIYTCSLEVITPCISILIKEM